MGMVVLKPNEIEAEMLTGITINDEDEAKKALEVLNKMGIKYPIISLGAKGIVYMKNNKVFHETRYSSECNRYYSGGRYFYWYIGM